MTCGSLLSFTGYYPVLHRFLILDNYVQDPYNTQNFNRYGYVYNNPLLYTDPSGEVFVPILIGAAVAAATYTVTALTADVPFTAGGLAKATLIGAASGAMTFGIGEAATAITQLAPKIAFQAVAHGMTQGVVSGIQGGNFWQGAASGALASIGASAWGGLGGNFARSGAGQITFGTISGGAGATLTGGNFWQGAATGFVVSALNHAFHNGYDKNGTKINDKGGDETDYLYDDDGNIIASTEVAVFRSEVRNKILGERGYGYKISLTSGALYDPTWDILGGALPVGKLFSGFKSLFAAKMGKGLMTPGKFFGSVSQKQAQKLLATKYGQPVFKNQFKKSFYNNRTRRSFTIHNEPGHGLPHVDINTRGWSKIINSRNQPWNHQKFNLKH